MKTKMFLAGLVLFAFTTVGMAQGTAKKAECSDKAKTECCKGKEGDKACCKGKEADKACCKEAKAEKAPAAKKAVAKPTAKK